MEIKPGLSALVTGGASGIGKGLALALAEKGVFITIVDFSEERGRQVASLVEKINTKFHSKLGFPSAIFVKCDVTNARDLAAAFETHLLTYGGLDICINSAGISSSIPFQKDQTDGTQTWRHTINVNFTAVIDSTRLAIKIMEASKRPGVIINLGSASGLYPVADTIYSGSKGGVVMFSRALRLYKREGIRVNVLCPEFVETEMTLKIDSNMVKLTGGFISMEMVVKGAFELIMDESKAGHCLWITNRRGMEYWPSPSEEAKYLIRRFRRRSDFKAPSIKPPESFEKIVVHTLTHNFRNATSVVRTSLRLPIKPKHVLVKIIYAGVNASDIPSKHALPVPRPDPEVVAMLTSGLTASIAQEKLAKLAGNTVVATCGGGAKAKLLKELGVDRVIDYHSEDVKTVLREEFPKGIDIIYESVGGDMLNLCLNALAVHGRLIVIGMISQSDRRVYEAGLEIAYQGEKGWTPSKYPGLLEKLLAKSQTVSGFFLVQYGHLWQEHLDGLFNLYSTGKLKVAVDPKKFIGLHSAADAVEYLHSGKSVGKVVVSVDPSFLPQVAQL
ncbi:hypothetical protein JHK82_019398 [Glycine max]|nr:hypothetical protein JHK82_019398 [Glycine max]